MRKKVIVEGLGSIGTRHAGLLQELGHDVACVTRRRDHAYQVFATAKEALLQFQPDYWIISTPTANHAHCLQTLMDCGFTGTLLMEKPLGMRADEFDSKPNFPVYVAYNMRFHPLVERVRQLLNGERVFAAEFSVGQYLPDWRPQRDYTQTYSAHQDKGGGVLRDLSHELDLACLILGSCQKLTARIGHWSDLHIDCEDSVDALLITEHCPSVTVHLDYLDRNAHRRMTLHTPTRTLSADLWHGILDVNGQRETFSVERSISFRKQLTKLLGNDTSGLCSWEEGLHVMRAITAMERAAQTLTWEDVI